MKTKMLLTLSAVGLAAITIGTIANAALLSPRAAGNQIIHTAGVANDPNLVAGNIYASPDAPVLSPRATGSQVSTTSGVASDSNPALACSRNMTASPKSIQACAANPANMPCCK